MRIGDEAIKTVLEYDQLMPLNQETLHAQAYWVIKPLFMCVCIAKCCLICIFNYVYWLI